MLKNINKGSLKKYFGFQDLISMVNVIKSGLRDLEKVIEKMSDDANEIKKPDEIVDIVEKILEPNE